jgi:hypothetical protein
LTHDSSPIPDSGATPGSDPRIITGSIPGEHVYRDVAGTVLEVDGCVSLQGSDGAVYPIIWPLGFQVQPDMKSVGGVHGTVAIGEKLTESRGFLIARDDFSELSDPAQLTGFDERNPDAETFLTLVNVEDFDTPE